MKNIILNLLKFHSSLFPSLFHQVNYIKRHYEKLVYNLYHAAIGTGRENKTNILLVIGHSMLTYTFS